MSVSTHEEDRGRNDNAGVVFWAERSDTFYVRSAILTTLLVAPLAFLAPAAFITAFLTVVGLGIWNRRAFRLQVTGDALRFRPSALIRGIRIPLSEVEKAVAEPESGSGFLPVDARAGRVLVHLRSGLVLPIPGIVDAAELARAITLVKRGQIVPDAGAA
ncbi:hypothetical protein [Zavarzinia sp. CC-PAN008]|uniref:hypothetical protein n=1 Tax=Zavarzinia sp. CC-PAN008 TaxID=3243332 RepID=UPI003F74A5A3